MDELEHFMEQLLAAGLDTQSVLTRGFDFALALSHKTPIGASASKLPHWQAAAYHLVQVAARLKIDQVHQHASGQAGQEPA